MVISAVDPAIGGVLALGDRGTGKSTAVRALAQLLPAEKAVAVRRYGCDPVLALPFAKIAAVAWPPANLRTVIRQIPVVDSPARGNVDRVVGALDLSRRR